MAAQHASGTFEVKLVPQGTPDKAEGSTLARMSLDKQYHGGLEATAKGEMLTAGTEVQGSALLRRNRASYRHSEWPHGKLRLAA